MPEHRDVATADMYMRRRRRSVVKKSPGAEQGVTLIIADLQVRLWSVPERRELATADVHEVATAVAWTPGGGRVAAGTLRGKVRFYAVDDSGRLEYEAQIGACFVWSMRHGRQGDQRDVARQACSKGKRGFAPPMSPTT